MSDGSSNGRTPGGWELSRRLDAADRRLAEMASTFITQAVFGNVVEDIKDIRTEIKEARAETAEQIATLQKKVDDAQKTRAQLWTAIGLLLVGGLISLGYALINKGLGVS